MNFCMEAIKFLDLNIIKHQDGHLLSSLYRKPKGNTTLEASSFHYLPLLNSIPYGQYIQAKRNCSTDALFEEEAANLRVRLRACGYSSFEKGLS